MSCEVTGAQLKRRTRLMGVGVTKIEGRGFRLVMVVFTAVALVVVALLYWGEAPEITVAALAGAAFMPILNWRIERLDARLKAEGSPGLSAPPGSRPSVLEELLKWGFLGGIICVGLWLLLSTVGA